MHVIKCMYKMYICMYFKNIDCSTFLKKYIDYNAYIYKIIDYNAYIEKNHIPITMHIYFLIS